MANVDTVILCIKGSNAVVLVGVIVIAVEEEAVEMASWFSKIARFVSKVVNSLLTCPRLDIETIGACHSTSLSATQRSSA